MPTIEETERRNGSQGLKLPYMLSLKPEQGGDASSKSQSPFEHFRMSLLSTSDYIDFIKDCRATAQEAGPEKWMQSLTLAWTME